jgi:predicted transcriptional regulator
MYEYVHKMYITVSSDVHNIGETRNMKRKDFKGKRRTVWLPNQLDEKAEEARKNLGLGKSAFYRFAILELIKEFTQNSTKKKEEQLAIG